MVVPKPLHLAFPIIRMYCKKRPVEYGPVSRLTTLLPAARDEDAALIADIYPAP